MMTLWSEVQGGDVCTLSPQSFELAGGSTIGRDHRLVPKNNQDAWYIATNGYVTAAVVCDGCGSSPNSEIGAWLGVRLITAALLRAADRGQGVWGFDRVRDDVIASLRVLVLNMGNLRSTVEDYFLFTVVGVVLTSYSARFFSAGDGMMTFNDHPPTDLGPFPENKPPYVGYGLLGDEVKFNVNFTVPLDGLEHFMIGCDGANQLVQLCGQNRKLPGLSKEIGPLSQFWEDDAIFANPAMISRRLKLVSRDWPPKDPEHGLLADDTTIVVGRRTYLNPEERE